MGEKMNKSKPHIVILIVLIVFIVIGAKSSVPNTSAFVNESSNEWEDSDPQIEATGPLSGKVIVINPGHGWYWNGSDWVLQRAYYYGVVEDFLTVDIVQYLNEFLLAQGATVYSTRELDLNAGNGTSGYPKWQEASRYHLEALGVDESVWNSLPSESDWTNDLRARPLYANSLDADILVNVHTNGSNGSGTGTETWYDSSNGQQAQSQVLASSIHNKIIGFAQSYNSSWSDRGVKSASGTYGENRLAQMPSALVEVAFHDREYPDNAALQDDAFKRAVALSICNGILEYFGESGTCEKPILIDQGHGNYYSLGNGDEWSYFGFVSALQDAGYEVESTTSNPITYDELANYSSYVIPLAGISPTGEENQAMQEYVENGGSLFLIADWGGIYSDPSQTLANVFGVTLDANTVTDPNDFIGGNDFWVTYDNANFSSHILMDGLNQLQTYASTAMFPGTASPLIITDPDASPPNRAIAVALGYGAGRVVIVGDSNYFSDANSTYPGTGLNVDDNKQFAVNTLNWLSRRASSQPPNAVVAFYDDGESGTSNWTYTSPWALVEVVSASYYPANGMINRAWTDSPDGEYANNVDTSLTSISIDTSALTNPTLSFLTSYDFEAGADYGYVEVSIDGGGTWTNVATYTGTNSQWTTEVVGLSNFAGSTNMMLRFRLVTNNSITHDGWYIDNVRIAEGSLSFSERTYLPIIRSFNLAPASSLDTFIIPTGEISPLYIGDTNVQNDED